MVTITFYDFEMAPSPRRARILLAVKGVPHETVEVDMRKAEQMGEAYRAINPNCTVPALKLEDGNVLTDNAGITAWAEATHPQPPVLGTDAMSKADIASWNTRVETELGYGVASALRNANPAMKDRALPGPHNYAQIPELAERGMAQIGHFYDMLEAHLEGKDYIAGGQLSVADITAFVFLDFAKVVRSQPSEKHANIARWRNALRARAEFQI